MEARAGTEPLVVVVGETSSGKTALALDLAERFDGEIICADSRTVYKGMDIGTAKPTAEERASIPHHLLDVVTPDQGFSAADFQQLATRAIKDIVARGKLPIMVGGTGLYIDAVLFDFQFADSADPTERERLQKLSVEQLQGELAAIGIPLPFNSRNPRHLMRALEIGGYNRSKRSLRHSTLILGLKIPKEVLQERITQRIDAMLDQGLVEEVRALAAHYGWDIEALRAPGYKAFRGYLQGSLTLEEARNTFIKNDLQLAKRQRTWFKRNNSIHWLENPSQAVEIVTTFLNK